MLVDIELYSTELYVQLSIAESTRTYAIVIFTLKYDMDV